jgi:hypothetical protein
MVRMGYRFGTTVYGKSDIVPGLFYVGTKFFHFYSFPLLPLGSVLAYENSKYADWMMAFFSIDRVCVSKDIPFNRKSLLFAIGRVFLLIFAVAAIGGSSLLFQFDGPAAKDTMFHVAAVVTSVLALIMFYESYRWAIATRERALELGALAGFPEDVVLRHLEFVGYPLRRPRKEFFVKRCGGCGELWPVNHEAARSKRVACPRCSTS